jgi:hypothetical protein
MGMASIPALLQRSGMWTLVVVEAIAKGAARMALEVLKMRDHAVSARLVRAHSTAALTAAL